MAKAEQASEVRRFTDIPNVGPAMTRDFERLGYKKPGDLVGQDGHAMYQRLCKVTATRHDPCVLDTFLAVAAFMNGGPPKPWWEFTADRKRRYPDV